MLRRNKPSDAVCKSIFTPDSYAGGWVFGNAARIDKILIADANNRIAGLGVPSAQPRTSIDPVIMLGNQRIEWRGFVSNAYITKRRSPVKLLAYVKLRGSNSVTRLNGSREAPSMRCAG